MGHRRLVINIARCVRGLLPVLMISGILSARPALAEVTILADQTCTSSGCHEELGTARNVHPAMEDGDCSSCHDQQGEGHEFEYPEEDNELCHQCHDAFEEKENQHPALEDGCTTCHNPHQSQLKALLEADSIKELCFNCHDESMLEAKWTHGPAEMGGCEICHNPHESDHESLLKESQTTLCLLCHEEIDSAFRASRYTHMSAREACTNCHDPHSAEREFFIKEDVPKLCFDCHGDIKGIVDASIVQHKVITTNRSCLTCHEPHASKHGSLLKDDAGALCNTCHAGDIDTPTGKIKGIGNQVANSLTVHPPVDDGECGSCHDPHGSQIFRLLREEYPENYFAAYSEETYALCFTCHDTDFLTTSTTDSLTEFRNGTRNLHFWHVTKMNNRCTSCHDVHASFHENLIRETSRLGQQEPKMNFDKTNTGGSCNPGCHDTLSYDRENPADVGGDSSP